MRHYSDGEQNRSPLDEMSDELGPSEEKSFWHPYDISPDHTIVRCEAEIRVDGETETVEVEVR